jgi:hypothetical protein
MPLRLKSKKQKKSKYQREKKLLWTYIKIINYMSTIYFIPIKRSFKLL